MEPLGISRDEASVALAPSLVERRSRVRHKVHTPAYVSLGYSSAAIVPDLNEISDISEDGICIQSSSVLDATGPLDMCLELGGRHEPVHIAGEVVWSNHLGRAGIHFSAVPPELQYQLKQWIFSNAIVGCANFAAADEVKTKAAHSGVPEPDNDKEDESISAEVLVEEMYPTVLVDRTAILAGLAAVKREVERLGDDFDSVLNLICQRLLAFCGATGSAVALMDGPGMVCRAAAGSDAPTLGMKVDPESGFSGQCIRSRQALRCEDSETNPYVDRESCRVLGIRSIIAVPIYLENSIAGLIEVFAPAPNAFDENATLILQSMAEMASSAVPLTQKDAKDRIDNQEFLRPEFRNGLGSPDISDPDQGNESGIATEIFTPTFTPLRRGLLAAAAITIMAAGAWLLSPRKTASPPASPSVSIPAESSSDIHKATKALKPVPTLDQERNLADKGDAVSQFALGVHYATGDGVHQDYSQAVHWFALAADQGHVGAQETLGAYYWAARGVPQDLAKAYFWSLLAQAGGDEASKYRVAILSSRLTHSQILDIQQQANDWLKQHQIASNKTHS